MSEFRKFNLYVFKCEHGKTCNFIADCPECARAKISEQAARIAELESQLDQKGDSLRDDLDRLSLLYEYGKTRAKTAAAPSPAASGEVKPCI